MWGPRSIAFSWGSHNSNLNLWYLYRTSFHGIISATNVHITSRGGTTAPVGNHGTDFGFAESIFDCPGNPIEIMGSNSYGHGY